MAEKTFMINLTGLTVEERKDLYKCLDAKEFLKYINKINEKEKLKKVVVKDFGKSLDRMAKGDYTKHFEELAANSGASEILLAFSQYLKANNPFINKIKNIIGDTSGDALSEEQNETLDKLKNAYDIKKYKTSFETLVKCCYELDELTSLKNENESLKEKVTKFIDLLENAKKELVTVCDNNNELNNKIIQAEKTIAEKDKAIEKLREKKELKETTSKLSEIIGEENIGKSFDEVYQLLMDKEGLMLKSNNYKKLRLILAAKYALVKYIEKGE